MDEICDVLLGGQTIGTATVRKVGLYYHIRCKCKLSGNVIYKIVAACNDNQVSLGICVPIGGCFGLETKLPVKRLGEGELNFRAVPKHQEDLETFVPIRPEEPFSYIDKLNKAYLAVRSGQVGVFIKERNA